MEQHPEPRSRWFPPRPRALLLLVLALQLGVPTYVLLTQDPPARFGWHMFAAVRPGPSATATLPSGDREVDLDPYVPRFRPEVDYVRVLPDHLCRQLEDATAVTVERGDQRVEQRCTP